MSRSDTMEEARMFLQFGSLDSQYEGDRERLADFLEERDASMFTVDDLVKIVGRVQAAEKGYVYDPTMLSAAREFVAWWTKRADNE